MTDFKFFQGFFIENNLTPRESQIEAIEKLAKHWQDKKYFILSAPCGVGKSFIAMSAIKASRNGFLLTSTKQLQQQYTDGPGSPVDLRGRGNYDCVVTPSMNCANAPCRTLSSLAERCMNNGLCPYVNQRNKAMNAQTLLTNYSYFLFAALCGPFSETRGDAKPREVMVCDEAHSLEDHLVSFAEIVLEGDAVSRETDALISFNVDDEDLELEIERTLKASKQKCFEIDLELKALFEDNGFSNNRKVKDLPKAIVGQAKMLSSKKERIDKWFKKLEIYFDTKEDIEWIIDHKRSENSVRLIPLEAKGLFNRFCEKLAKKFIFMSATMGDPEEFAIELGLDFKDCCLITCESDFPPENAPIVPFNVAKMSYSALTESLPKIVAAVDNIMKHHPNDKGIIHTANYRIAKHLAEHCEDRHRFVHKSGGFNDASNEELFKIHKKRKDPTVLLSPSMGTGISLDDELARFQIIVKLPFASMADIRVKRKMAIREGWYSNKMFLELMQSSGRAIRSKEDSAVTYILDGAWTWFFDKSKKKLPKWFKDRIVKRN